VSQRNLPLTWANQSLSRMRIACKYCYARYTHEFMERHDGSSFERKISSNSMRRNCYGRELKRVKRGEEIAIGTRLIPISRATAL